MPKSKKAQTNQRILLVFAVSMAVLIYAICWLIHWQLVRGAEFNAYVKDQSMVTTALTAERGTIYDTNGEILAQSASVWSVVLSPYYISDENRVVIADGLSEILDMDREAIYKKTGQSESYFTYLARKVEDDVKDEILEFMAENKITNGIELITDYKRYYPYSTLASSVIGFTGTDNNGLYGIEYQYDKLLSGVDGQMVSLQNALGGDMPVEYEQLIEAEDGYDLVLTIDATVQSICEKYILEAIEKHDVDNGACAIVMNVDNGEIIALATSDQFNLNDPFTLTNEKALSEIDELSEEEQKSAYNTALYSQWKNKAITDTYYPGSVFKMVTAASLLDSGTITVNSTYTCTGSYVVHEGVKPINCWIGPIRGHGALDVSGAICASCNPFFMQATADMGATTFFNYFDAFGFTQKTGIDLPGEANSIYYTAENLGPAELATESFGQNFSITPIQMIAAVASIANGGHIVQPHVVDMVMDSNGNIIENYEYEYKTQVVSEEVTKNVVDALVQNTTDGSGTTGAVVGYEIAGKTGTSEKVADYVEENGMEYIASYAGFNVSEGNQYALLVFLDEPDQSTASGAKQAGPVFASIMQEILPYLGVQAQYTDEEYAAKVTETPNLANMTIEEAKKVIEDAGLDWEVYGNSKDSDTVNMQIPYAGNDIPKNGKVIITSETSISDSDMITVPDFIGLTASQCYALAEEVGVQVVVIGTEQSGNLRAQYQSVALSQSVRPGTVITISISDFSDVI